MGWLVRCTRFALPSHPVYEQNGRHLASSVMGSLRVLTKQQAPPASPRQRIDWQSMCRRRAAAYKELLQRQQRQAKLGGLAQRMALQKQLMVRSHEVQASCRSALLAG